MGLTISSLFNRLFGKKQMRILMGKLSFIRLDLLYFTYCLYVTPLICMFYIFQNKELQFNLYPGIFYFRRSYVFADTLNLFISLNHVQISELSTGKKCKL